MKRHSSSISNRSRAADSTAASRETSTTAKANTTQADRQVLDRKSTTSQRQVLRSM